MEKIIIDSESIFTIVSNNADVLILAGDGQNPIYAHKIILEECDYFQRGVSSAISLGCQEGKFMVCRFPDHNESVVRSVITKMYNYPFRDCLNHLTYFSILLSFVVIYNIVMA